MIPPPPVTVNGYAYEKFITSFTITNIDRTPVCNVNIYSRERGCEPPGVDSRGRRLPSGVCFRRKKLNTISNIYYTIIEGRKQDEFTVVKKISISLADIIDKRQFTDAERIKQGVPIGPSIRQVVHNIDLTPQFSPLLDRGEFKEFTDIRTIDSMTNIPVN